LNTSIKHPGLLKKGGVHLSFIANDIFRNQIQGALETFLKYAYCLVTINAHRPF
jgi:hypothetical protein